PRRGGALKSISAHTGDAPVALAEVDNVTRLRVTSPSGSGTGGGEGPSYAIRDAPACGRSFSSLRLPAGSRSMPGVTVRSLRILLADPFPSLCLILLDRRPDVRIPSEEQPDGQ